MKHLISFILLISIISCGKDNPTVVTEEVIGVWKVEGSRILWEGDSISGTSNISTDPNDYHIEFRYLPPHPDYPDLPRVKFTLIDNLILNHSIANSMIEHHLDKPYSFDLLSEYSITGGFTGTPDYYEYSETFLVYCENDSSVDKLTLMFYSDFSLERKYVFATNKVGRAIKQIACD